jgi:tRNA(Ile)-lysidine synthetase-like protein
LIVTAELFASIINEQNFQHNTKFVVGVSGGVDSMSLVFLFNELLLNTYETNENLIAVTVDHQLTDGSSDDALQIHAWLSAKNIQHEILTWEHDTLSSRIEEDGRTARYRLLGDFCEKVGSNTLYIAHHALDQAETFLMRLRRGSGLTGLCAIRPRTVLHGVLVCRPLLGVYKQDLIDTLRERFGNHPHLTDPNNSKKELERVAIRQNMKALEECGICAKGIVSSVKHLQDIDEQLQQLAKIAIRNFVRNETTETQDKTVGNSVARDQGNKKNQPPSKKNKGNPGLKWGVLEENGAAQGLDMSRYAEITKVSLDIVKECMPQVVKIVLRECFIRVTTFSSQVCSQKTLDRLYEKITKRDFRGATASGCVIRRTKEGLEVTRENRKKGRQAEEGQLQRAAG